MVKIEEVKPILDANLNDEERKELRAQRAAAAEQRLQQKGLKQPKKKKKRFIEAIARSKFRKSYAMDDWLKQRKKLNVFVFAYLSILW